METGVVLEIEPLLVPIEGANPSGRNLVYEAEFDELSEARRQEEQAGPDDPWRRDAKVADWNRVLELGCDCLARKSKDLQIAAWITEALAHRHGFAGVRDGFHLLRELVDRYWDTVYPEKDGDDLEYRASPFAFLNQDRTLPLIIREIPLTGGPKGQKYSFLRWQESHAVDNLIRKDPEKRQELLDEGKITGEQFEEAVSQSPRRFYEALNADLEAAWDAYKQLDKVLDARFGKQAPGLVGVRKAMEDVRRVLVPILETKRSQEPDSGTEVAEEVLPEGPESGEQPGGREDVEARTEAQQPRDRRHAAGGPIADAQDAIRRILEASRYLRENDPSSPVPHAVVRAVRLAELYALGNPPDSSGLASPTSQTRQELKRLATEESWDALLEQAEEALGRPEGRAWLDAHRYALTAMSSGSADRSAAIGVCRALLRAVLAEYPELPRAELADDTPTANAETRAWIESEILPPSPPPSEPEAYLPPIPPVDHANFAAGEEPSQTEPDPWELALEDVRGGRPSEGLNRLRLAMTRAGSGRDRFARKLQMAELCLTIGNHRIALPLLEELAKQIDEFHLEQWEEESLCARVWGALYRALRDSGAGEENGQAGRLRDVYTRLCRLDINQAMSYDNR